MRRAAVLAVAAGLTALPLALAGQTRPSRSPSLETVAWTGITVIAMDGTPPRSDMTVLLRGRHIAAVGRSAEVTLPAGTRVLDGRGRYLIPGLWDMHVHLAHHAMLASPDPSAVGRNPDWFGPLFLAYGVTGVRDMAGDLALLRRWREMVTMGELLGPRMVVTGRKLGSAPVVPEAPFPITSEADVRSSVRLLKIYGADFVKLGNIDPRLLPALMDESRRQGLEVVGHAPTAVSLDALAHGGLRSLEHMTGVLLATASSEAAIRRDMVAQDEAGRLRRLAERFRLLPTPDYPWGRMLADYDSARAQRLAVTLRRAGVWQVPTIGLMARVFHVDEAPRMLAARYSPRATQPSGGGSIPWAKAVEQRAVFAKHLEVLRLMRAAGVPVLAGSDSPDARAIPGLSLQEELSWLVAAGYTPEEALTAATRGPAEFLGALDSLGTVAPGKLADLVILQADPLEDIANVARIEAVVVNGRVLERAELDRLLAGAARLAARWRTQSEDPAGSEGPTGSSRLKRGG